MRPERPVGTPAARVAALASSAGRLTAGEIYDQVLIGARSELDRTTGALAFSGLVSGMFMGLTGLGVAGTLATLPGQGHEFIAELFYPLGFIAVVIGRAQLFTENTLFPIVLVLQERRHLFTTLRLWTAVFVTNIVGALAFASLATVAVDPAVVTELVHLGATAAHHTLMHVFTSAILGGVLIAFMAWMVAGAQYTIGQIAVVWLMTFPVGLLGLAHCIASSGYIIIATFAGAVTVGTYAAWLGVATAGNIAGGVLVVSLLNYAQVRTGGR